MLGNIEATSHETIRVASGNAPVLLSSVIFFNKWVVPLIDKGRACARGLRSDKFSMAVPQHDVINRIFTYFYNEEARTGETFTRAFARTTSSSSKYIYIYIYIYIYTVRQMIIKLIMGRDLLKKSYSYIFGDLII